MSEIAIAEESQVRLWWRSSADPMSVSRPGESHASDAGEAVVQDVPGVTRDRVSYDATWNGRQFVLVDTGGWAPDAKGMAALGHRAGRTGRRRG